ncbi:MAG: hypothetical protein ACREM6_16445, partial [Vulcanimicrobiaceae bacterium]
ILGIDPGTQKCGYAVIDGLNRTPVELGIVPVGELAATVRRLVGQFGIATIALGSGTQSTVVAAQLCDLGVPIATVDERATTLGARARYFAAHPPTGWRRLVPRGMLLPPRPIDDFAAVLIAERYVIAHEACAGDERSRQ